MPILEVTFGIVHSNGSVSVFKTATSGDTLTLKMPFAILEPPKTIILLFGASIY
jgi:hypothetical protein